MKKGDVILCYKSFKKGGIEIFTKGVKYHLQSDIFSFEKHHLQSSFEYDKREIVMISTNKNRDFQFFLIHKPSLIKRIITRIYNSTNNVLTIKSNTKYFSDYFYNEKDIRKLKLKKLETF